MLSKEDAVIKRWQNTIVIVSLAASIALVLWLTLFSRIGSDYRHFYPPFWSYRAILNRSSRALVEDTGNIILFIPIGVALALILQLDVKKSSLVGFALSLIIESFQWFFWLGSFEIDDLIHNTFGVGIGAEFVNRVAFGKIIKPESRRRSFVSLVVLTALIVSFGFVYQGLRWQSRERLAALHNREDGAANLLVLNGEDGYVGESKVYVSFRDDGGIDVSGSSGSIGYLLIGNPTLVPGSYTLTGFSGVEQDTVGIYLEKNVDGKYVRFTSNLGPVDTVSFTMEKAEKIRAYIKTYPGAKVDVTAYPVIYKEE